ncbi:hypothetical protein [Agromyces badenianii]|uniref:hypothetical protein n=1 Tax=Agromyces badenianii TaxID=2080742 RepID=UPI000D59C568|nr:hypothetical protein [Agromyces badenianii]PWC05431.1 hypothetical protein DCE94_03930 [Agromyces badenianii]
MNIRQTTQFLARVNLLDNRDVDQAIIAHWHELIGHLDYDDALTALKHHASTSTAYLMPAHIVAGAARAREASLPPRSPATPETCAGHKFLAHYCVHCGAWDGIEHYRPVEVHRDTPTTCTGGAGSSSDHTRGRAVIHTN